MRRFFGKYEVSKNGEKQNKQPRQIIISPLHSPLGNKGSVLLPIYLQEESLDAFTEQNGYYKSNLLFFLSK
jgi:hypothetical protein